MITFVIPDFFRSIEQTGSLSDFPVLAKILSKAKKDENIERDFYRLICQLCGAPDKFEPAIAAIEQHSLIDNNSANWSCCATPVIISPNRDHLDLAQISGFNITEEEAKGFSAEFNDYFKEDGLRFSFDTPDKWYCHLEKDSAADFKVSEASPFDIDGDDIAPHIPKGKDGANWRKIFNETQMLLHHSATNHKRSQLAKPEINSVWYWGGGRSNDGYSNPELTVFSDNLFVRGVAKLGCSNIRSLSLALDIAELGKNNLFVEKQPEHNYEDWDANYFSPALRALKQGKVNSITFYFDSNKKYVLCKNDLLQFWRTTKKLTYFM
ncbi:MAG: hypothetical protein OEM38_04670 [Gammaproteobacteria bacterium]|nr:hypothetical protein [Gammaproteobacteria bacterium]